MGQRTMDTVTREVIREYLDREWVRLTSILEETAKEFAPLISHKARMRLWDALDADSDGKDRTRYQEAIEAAAGKLRHLIDHACWSGREDLQPILDELDKALKGGSD